MGVAVEVIVVVGGVTGVLSSLLVAVVVVAGCGSGDVVGVVAETKS